MSFTLTPIGKIHSPYKQKFAIPRQPRLISSAIGSIELFKPYDNLQAFEGLESFSHLWVIFIFHQTMQQGWSPQVRPPRLGGQAKKGVFATRSTFRPNPTGLSAVTNLGIRQTSNKLWLDIGGLDLVDGTPVIDIKPYLPYSDSILDAEAGFAQDAPSMEMRVSFSQEAESACTHFSSKYPKLKEFITQVIQQDPRPAHKKRKNIRQEFAVYLYEFNIRWQVENNCSLILSIEDNCS